MEKLYIIGFFAAILAVIYFLGMRITPYKPAYQLMERGLLGMGILLVWNLIAAPFGLSLGLNPITALVSGALGAPGLGLLLIVKLM